MAGRKRYVLIGAALVLALASRSQAQTVPVAEEFEKLHFRSIGPATMSGRISDLAVYEANPAIYYVGTAHGGVWKTTSNGAMFTPLFQNQGLISIGDVTVSQKNPDLVWVGAGESNNRQSTSWGGGVFKSTDGGQNFQLMGLAESKHIGRIIIDPNNNDIVLVAATGPLFGPGGQRGVYKTIDGGKTWKQVLKGDDDTGVNDLAMSATDPRVLFAATYQRRRTACCMNGGGLGSGIWKSTDGGETWTRLVSNGWPLGPLGRIAVDVYRKNGNIVYASIEGPGGGGRGGNEEAGPGAAADTAGGGRGGRGGAGGGPGGGPNAITGLYRSDDGGANWKRVSNVNPRPMYFSQVRIDPNNADRVYMGGVGMQMTIDGGQNFNTDAAQVIHDDIHAIWIDPNNSDHLVIGGDGGLGVTYDMSKTWTYLPNLPVGLFYHVGYDMETPFNVCGGMQDNYDWCGPSASRHSRGIFNSDWFQVQGGDGFVALPDQRDSRIVYTESQDGNIIRRNKITGESKNIRPTPANVLPTPPRDEPAYRFHWDTPMILSPHDPGVLIVAANRVFRSTNRGDTWTAISPDLTTNANRNDIVTMGLKNSETNIARNDGIQTWPTIVALAESPKKPGLYFTGTDDGVVSMSKDAGKTWTNLTSRLVGFPTGAFVSEVVPSRYDSATVYITVDNHRLNDYSTYIWVSNDLGATFHSLNANLNGEAVKTLTEDQKNPDVLYVGTETGLFLSLDRGRSWRRFKANLPSVRVDEITLHPRDNSMIVATHGRALWILDHLEPIQEYAATQRVAAAGKLFTVPAALQWKSKDDQNEEFWGHQWFTGENPPTEATISYYLKSAADSLKLRITDVAGRAVREVTPPLARKQPGIQTACWDMRVAPIEVPADSAAGRGGAGGGGGRGGAGGGGRGGPPGVGANLPPVGYMAANPCSTGESGQGRGGGGGGFGGGGGLGGPGPHVVPGTYNVALVVNGHEVDKKPLRIIADPKVQLTIAQRANYNAIVADLHELQRRGTVTARSLNALYPQFAQLGARLDSASAPAAVKTQFETLKKEFDGVRVKFGVPIQTGAPGRGGGGGGGGGRGGGADPSNVLGRVSALKTGLMAIWETPSPALLSQYTALKLELPRAITEANAFLTKARAANDSFKRYNVTLTVATPGQ